MARVYGMKSCMSVVSARIHRENWRECTYEETLRLRLNVKEDEREARRKTDPEDDQTRNQPDEGRHRCQVPEGLRAQEPRECVLLHGAVAVLLLSMEHVRDLSHERDVALGLRLMSAAKREGVDTQCWGQVNLVVLI